jgi:uncharacterized membrane protein YeaQ/YmgE (transglycosylase-associated protein family)
MEMQCVASPTQALDESSVDVLRCLPRSVWPNDEASAQKDKTMMNLASARDLAGLMNLSLHSILWFVLIGWSAGWVTGRAIKGSGYGVYGDIVLGVVGGLTGGWLMRNTDRHGNWGFLLSAIVVALSASLLTWLFRSVIQHQTWRVKPHGSEHAHGRA